MEKEKIGMDAGRVWYAVNEEVEISLRDLSQKLSMSVEEVSFAIGWLARENNICIRRKNGIWFVRNEGGSNFFF